MEFILTRVVGIFGEHEMKIDYEGKIFAACQNFNTKLSEGDFWDDFILGEASPAILYAICPVDVFICETSF